MRRYYWLAADAGQGALAIDAIRGFVDRTPSLVGRVDIQARRVLVPSTGAMLEVLPADAAGAWGLLPDGVFVDELAQWEDTPQPQRLWEAVSSAVAKASGAAAPDAGLTARDVLASLRLADDRLWVDAAHDFQLADALGVLEDGARPYSFLTRARGASKTTDLAAVALALLLAGRPHAGAILVVLTTAGSPDHFAHKILEHARTSPLWRVSERPGPSPWMDATRLAEQRARLPEAVYRQLFENEWTQAAGSFLDPAVIDAAFSLDGPTLDRTAGTYFAGLDLGTVNDRTVLAIGHREHDEIVRLDRMQTWQGSRARPVDFSEIEDFIVSAHQRFGFTLRLDPWQGLDLAQRLRTRSVRAEEFAFSAASKQRLAATLLSSLNAGNLQLDEAEGLREELLALRLVQKTSGAWAFDHARGGHDDRATALALMTVAALENPVVTATAPIFGTRQSPSHIAGLAPRQRGGGRHALGGSFSYDFPEPR
jgi:hypothetical protein